MVTRINVGTEFVPGDDSITNALDFKHPLGGNLLLFPLRNRVRRNSESSREFLLRSEMLENPSERVIHMPSFLHYGLRKRNRQLIDAPKPSVENENMPDTPRPEHFSSFKDWLEATRRAHGLKKAAIAEVAKKSPQAASKWFKGGNVEPEPLKRIAEWAGVPYLELRMLLEGQPLTTQKRRNGSAQATSHVVHRLSKKIEQLSGDDTSMVVIEGLIDSLLSVHTKGRKRAPKE
jgi:transcriptional regulator with XRE-family HTH domain